MSDIKYASGWLHPDEAEALRAVIEQLRKDVAALEAKMKEPYQGRCKDVLVIFDGPPSQVAGRFVDCEDGEGTPIKAGEWEEGDDEFWRLRIKDVIF